LSCCSQWGKGRALLIQSVSPIKSTICIADVEERDMTEKDEDDEGAMRFATLESRFENKETVRNWFFIIIIIIIIIISKKKRKKKKEIRYNYEK